MDVIVIGKRNFNRSDKPEVIYCGQSKLEALAAVEKTNGSHPFLYYVNPEVFQRINAPGPKPVEAAEVEQHKSKSKSKK
jgi:hypothetical protein